MRLASYQRNSPGALAPYERKGGACLSLDLSHTPKVAQSPALISAKFRPDLQPRLSYQQTRGDAVNPADYARMAEECSRQADAMRPGTERDALMEKARLYRSYARLDNWVASRELQPPS